MAVTAMKNDKRTSENLVLKLYSEQPHLSIDEVARTLDKGRFFKLHKSEISRLRALAKQKATGIPYAEGPRKPAPFNPPHFSAKEAPVAPAKTAVREFPPSTHDQRKAWLESWALDNPSATNKEAMEALREQFGMAINTAEVGPIMKLARQITGTPGRPQEKPLEAPPEALKAEEMTEPTEEELLALSDALEAATAAAEAPVEVPAPAPVVEEAPAPAPVVEAVQAQPAVTSPPTLVTTLQTVVRQMKEHGLKKVEIRPDGTVSFEMDLSL